MLAEINAHGPRIYLCDRFQRWIVANPFGNPENLKHLPPGKDHPKWNSDRMIASTGYAKVRVGREHPLADPNGYTYEHLLVWVAAGRERPGPDHVIHHENGDKLDNRIENLRLLSRREHAEEHHAMVPDAVVVAIRERYAAGETGTSLAKAYSLPVARVYRFIKGEARANAGGPISTGSLRGRSTTGAKP